MNNMFYITVKALILHNEKFLIIKRSEKARGDYYYWEFPGGRLEFGESPDDALSREIMEETGLQTRPICPINTWSFFKDENTEAVGITFLCKTDTDSVDLSKEHDEYVWITYDELNKYNVIPNILDDMIKINMNEIYSKLNRDDN
jgi:8-oxo-dGTP diphosphatase